MLIRYAYNSYRISMSYGVYWVKNVQKKMRILNTLPNRVRLAQNYDLFLRKLFFEHNYTAYTFSWLIFYICP